MEGKEIKAMIVAELKEQGLDIAEDVAIRLAKVILGLVPKIVVATDTKIDDMFLPVLGIIEPKLMELLDQIDGKKDL